MAERSVIVLVLLNTVIAAAMAAIGVAMVPHGPKAVDEWFQTLPHAHQKLTKIHFFFHDTISGKNPTALLIAGSNLTAQSPTHFGFLAMADDPLTAGPHPGSQIIGRAQGIYGSASFSELGFLMTFNLVFTAGKYNGSTLSLLGHNPILHRYREIPIVGGSGVFRLAQGVATAKTYWVNLTARDAIVEYHVVVLHY